MVPGMVGLGFQEVIILGGLVGVLAVIVIFRRMSKGVSSPDRELIEELEAENDALRDEIDRLRAEHPHRPEQQT